MGNAEQENLRELSAGFMNEESARRAAEDIEKGDELLRKWSGPELGEKTMAEIKGRVISEVRRRRAIAERRRIWATAAVAAAIMIGAVFMIRWLERRPTEQATARYAATIPARVWESSDITKDDADISVLTAEVEAIENELGNRQMKETIGNGSAAAGDLELQLIEIGGDIWKG